jgi:hypothetical protein
MRSAAGGGLVSPRLAPPKLRWVRFDGLLDVVGRGRGIFLAFIARHPREGSDRYGRREHDEGDENDTAGSHIGSL